MNLTEEQKQRKEHLLSDVENFPLDESYKTLPGFPIPLTDYLFVKKITGNTGQQETEGGIILVPNAANNTTIPFTGLIYAVGYGCSEFLIPGQRILYNPFADFEIMIKGVVYIKMQERDVIGIIPPDAWVHLPVKSDAQLIREERVADMAGYKERLKAKEENEKDKASSKKK